MSAAEREIVIELEPGIYQERIDQFASEFLTRLKRILRGYTAFHLFFLLFLAAEILYFFIHLALFLQTFVVALHLALIVATIFCYITLQLYAQGQKEEKLIALREQFLTKCRTLVDGGGGRHPLAVAHAACQLADRLRQVEFYIYHMPSWRFFPHSALEGLNGWLFWHDLHAVKEGLLIAFVEEHVQLVRAHPTDLQAHASLANAYVMLSGLYVDPRTIEGGGDEERWSPSKRHLETFKKQFRVVAERAVEEFKILSEYAPDDPWVHTQLAYSYRDLQMPSEEIREYEILLKLCPDDQEVLFKLGKLYFEQGCNAKGLRMYEALRRTHYKKAERLIHLYGTPLTPSG